MLTASFLRELETIFGKKRKTRFHIKRVTPLSGGSINLAARLDTSAGNFFLKVNDAFRFPKMFEKEKNGLSILKGKSTLSIPTYVDHGDIEDQSFLVLEFIDSARRQENFWSVFGAGLASQHRVTTDRFGFMEDNYIGSLQQRNNEHSGWSDFFFLERLEPQMKMAMSKKLLNETDSKHLQALYNKLEELIPFSPPSLLHGDLWSGNFMTGKEGEPCIFDPAVYYGHREMDLSMSKLFGGFEEEFYKSYHEQFPIEPGFEERVPIHNLYPLLVHVNLFGSGYVAQVRSILKRFN